MVDVVRGGYGFHAVRAAFSRSHDARWDRLGLPHYWLHLWGRVRLEVPWLSLLDDVMKRAIEPVPELVHLYGAAKDAFVEMHAAWTSERHDFRMLRRARGTARSVWRVSEAHCRRGSQKSRAWGLKTSIDTVGPLQCVVADNFWEAMVEASGAWWRTTRVPSCWWRSARSWRTSGAFGAAQASQRVPRVVFAFADAIKDALLFNFEVCEDYQITCAESDRAIVWIALPSRCGSYCLRCCCVWGSIFSVFLCSRCTRLALIPFRVWNYRWTCLPNVPVLLDDILMWLACSIR